MILKGGVCVMGCVMLSSCVAQQADLERFQETFDNRISQLDQEKKALEDSLKQAEGMLEKQRTELDQLVKARAQINSELRNLRDENLTSLSGNLETESYRIDQLNQELDNLKSELANLQQMMEERDTKRAASIKNLETALTKKMAQRDVASQNVMESFSHSLSDFKQVLNTVSTQLEQETQRAVKAEGTIQQQVDLKQAAFEKKLDEDTEALRTYIKQEVETLAAATSRTSNKVDSGMQNLTMQLEEVQSQLERRIEGVSQALEGTTKDLEATTGTVAELKQVLNASLGQLGDTVDKNSQQLSLVQGHVTQLDAATKRFETDIADNHAQLQQLNQSLGQLHQTLKDTALQISQKVDIHSSQVRSIQDVLTNLQTRDLQFEKDSLAAHKQLQDLSQSVSQIQQVLNQTGTTIGQRVDELAKVTAGLDQRLSQVEAHEASLTQKLENDTRALRTYVEQNVKSNLESIGQLIESLRLKVDQELEQVQHNTQHMQEMSQSVSKLQEAFNAVGGMLGQRVDVQLQTLGQLEARLGQLEQDQSVIKEKLNSDTQMTSSHLSQVNASIKSVSDALTQVEQALVAKVGDLERRMNESQPGSENIQVVQQEMAATVQHVNQLTDTVSQLREVIQSMGTKIGARVDQQAQQLNELAKQFNRLQGKSRTASPGKK